MDRILLVDGHSIIFAWESLRAMHARGGVMAREHLIRLLTDFQDSTDWRVAVVFDGCGSKPDDASQPGGIQVFYSRAGQTADALIERLAAKHARRVALTVASNDRLERETVEALGASSIDSEGLRGLLDAAGTALRGELDALRKGCGRQSSSNP